MDHDAGLAHRFGPRLLPDRCRVIAKLFVPGEELPDDTSHGDAVIDRVLAMSDGEVAAQVAAVTADFAGRHRDLAGLLRAHFEVAVHRRPSLVHLPEQRQMLIGACFTLEYAIEAAALFNPSMVAHPDQNGLSPGELRFLMSVRAVGEGHLSTVEFRTGVLAPGPTITLDPPGSRLTAGTLRPARLSRHLFRAQLVHEGADPAILRQVLAPLPHRFEAAQLRAAVDTLHPHLRERRAVQSVIAGADRLAAEEYEVGFPPTAGLGERVLVPRGPAERHGIEDVRLVRFVAGNGTATYHGTYTAYDGTRVASKLLTTSRFVTVRAAPLSGSAARDKGMALFPRLVGGRYLALSRRDRRVLSLAWSTDLRVWHTAETVRQPAGAWNLVQVGNCGSPIETEAGWLVITHGVGPLRTYTMGATLLDRDNPHLHLATLPGPLLRAGQRERDGYVPNTVYSCGALRHGDTLVIPYGASDSTIGFAHVGITDLLSRMC